MLFRNTADVDISFRLATTNYKVGAFEVVEVPDKFAYAIASMGLPMEVEVAKPAPPVVAKSVQAVRTPRTA